jgi:deoxyadenosine/deoxycytidine kinase
MDSPQIILLEGNIAVGKSTVGRVLKTHGYTVVMEDDVLNEELLKNFGANPTEWAFAMQHHMVMRRTQLIEQTQRMREVISDTHDEVIRELMICPGNSLTKTSIQASRKRVTRQVLKPFYADRSWLGDAAFFYVNFVNGNITDAQADVYFSIWNTLPPTVPMHLIWLDCDPSIAHQRLNRRGNECESSISIQYLQQLDHAHFVIIMGLMATGDALPLPHVLQRLNLNNLGRTVDVSIVDWSREQMDADCNIEADIVHTFLCKSHGQHRMGRVIVETVVPQVDRIAWDAWGRKHGYLQTEDEFLLKLGRLQWNVEKTWPPPPLYIRWDMKCITNTYIRLVTCALRMMLDVHFICEATTSSPISQLEVANEDMPSLVL